MFPIPRKALDQHVITLGKTGSGKSSAIRDLVEGLLEEGVPVTIVDPKGDWWGLKSSADGKHEGYPLVIFGGEHGDVPLNARSGATVAELTATGNRPSIVDLGGWMPGDRTQFWIDFASTFFKMARGKRWLVIDEVHNLAPKGKLMSPEANRMLHWSNRLASEGRGKGITLISASQRPQKVHNDFLTSCETLIAMRVIHMADRNALKDWVDGCGDAAVGKELIDTVASMKRGEGWVWSPEIEFGPERVKFPMFKTYDSFKPQNADAPAKLKGWADVDLADVTKKLEAVVKEAEANDPAKLKARIRELEANVKKTGHSDVNKNLQVQTKVVTDEKAVQRAVLIAIQDVKKFYEAQLLEADCRLDAWEQTRRLTGEAWAPVNKVCSTPFEPRHYKVSAEVQPERPKHQQQDLRPKTIKVSPAFVKAAGGLVGAARRILEACAQSFPDAQNRSQVGVLAGISTKVSTWRAGMAELRRFGYIEESGHEMRATHQGIAAIGGVPSIKTAIERVNMWRSKFSGAALMMFNVLIDDARGGILTKEELGNAARVDPATSTWRAGMAVLRKARVVDESSGGIRAVESLF